MIYKTIFKKGNKYLAKIVFDDVGEKWASTTQAVFNFAQKNFEDGEEVDVEYTVKNGQYSVSKIKKVGSGSKKTEPTPEETAEFTCEDCGATLKDGKYKKCYTCNKKNPSKKETSSKPTCEDCGKELKDSKYKKCYECNQKNPSPKKGATKSYGYTPKDVESIKDQVALKSACEAVKVLQGLVTDPSAVADIVENLYQRFRKLL